jgi:hypothetical protein
MLFACDVWCGIGVWSSVPKCSWPGSCENACFKGEQSCALDSVCQQLHTSICMVRQGTGICSMSKSLWFMMTGGGHCRRKSSRPYLNSELANNCPTGYTFLLASFSKSFNPAMSSEMKQTSRCKTDEGRVQTPRIELGTF